MNTKGLTKTQVILIAGFAVLLIGGGIAFGLLMKSQKAEPSPTPQIVKSSGSYVVDESNLEEIGKMVSEKNEKSQFQTYMNTVWRFPDGKSASSNAVVGNSDVNNYPFFFTVTLKDSGEVVYTSSLIPVGASLKQLVLEKELDKGEYEAICTYHMVDENDEEVESNLGFGVTIKIEK